MFIYLGRNNFDEEMKIFNRTLVFDIGTKNTIVCENGQVVFDERTKIAFSSSKGDVEIGSRAGLYSTDDYRLVDPIVGGIVRNQEAYDKYVKCICKKLVWFPRLFLKSVVIALPNHVVSNKSDDAAIRAYIKPFRELGVKDIKIIPQGIAAHFGSQKQKMSD